MQKFKHIWFLVFLSLLFSCGKNPDEMTANMNQDLASLSQTGINLQSTDLQGFKSRDNRDESKRSDSVKPDSTSVERKGQLIVAGEEEYLVSASTTVSTALPEEPAVISAPCNITNYELYIYDKSKTDELIRETGQGCQLPGAQFQNKDFTGAYFRQANLIEANFDGAILHEVSFFKAKMMGVSMNNAKLNRQGLFYSAVNMEGVNMEGGSVQNADLTEVVFLGSNLRDVIFRGAIVTETKFQDTDLQNADFRDAKDMYKAYFGYAKLEGTIHNHQPEEMYVWGHHFLNNQGIADSQYRGMIDKS